MQTLEAVSDLSLCNVFDAARDLAITAGSSLTTVAEPYARSGAVAVHGALEAAQRASNSASDFAFCHSWATAAIVAGLGVAMAPGVVVAPALGAAGFTDGVIAGSAAAAAQRSIGNVAAGSIFATLQSAGAGGYGLAVVNGVIQSGGLVVASTSGAVMARSKF